MDHEFSKPVILVVEFLEADSKPTTLSRVTRVESDMDLVKFYGKNQRSEDEQLVAIYRRSSFKGWYIERELED